MTVLVKKKAAELYDLRYLILNQVRSIRLDGKDLLLEVDTTDYLLASFNELIRYAGKGLIAYEDFCLEPRLTSRIWRYVTLYYSLYFFAVAFGRIAGRSVIYINSSEALHVTTLFSLLAGTDCRFKKGNYVITLDKPEEPLAIRETLEIRLVALAEGGSHESSWSQFYEILNMWRTATSGRPFLTVNGIRNCLARKTSVFSEARNNLNYRGKYTLKELDNQIVFLGPDNRNKSLDELDREIQPWFVFPPMKSLLRFKLRTHWDHFFTYFLSMFLMTCMVGMPHPGSHYVKQLAKRVLAP